MRVQGHILRTYPGLVRHLTAFQNQQLQQLEVKTDLLGTAEAWLLGEDLDPMASHDPTWEIFIAVCMNMPHKPSTRFTTAWPNCALATNKY